MPCSQCAWSILITENAPDPTTSIHPPRRRPAAGRWRGAAPGGSPAGGPAHGSASLGPARSVTCRPLGLADGCGRRGAPRPRMCRAGGWAPLLLCLLQSAPGRLRLAPPQNVTLLSENFTIYLTWLPGLGSPQNVTYFVSYQGSPNPRRWQKVEQCAGTRALVCPLMCLKKQDLYNKFKGRVQAVSAGVKSARVESNYLEYLSEVEPAPPTLIITRTKNILRVSATYQLPACIPSLNLKYDVEFWKESTGSKTLFTDTAHGQTLQIPLQPGVSGRHCLSARTIYTFNALKYSHFSEPSCIFLETRGTNWVFLALVSLLPLLLAAATAGVIWKKLEGNPWFEQVKRPRALDFSGYGHPMTAFPPGRRESLDELFLCPQKELTRKIRPGSQVGGPATFQAESDKDGTEDEDDDADDSGSFQPYLEPPLFLRKELQVTGHSEAEESGVESGRPWTPPAGSEGSSAWDSTDRSWSSTVDSSLRSMAGSSSYLDKKELDQRPGGNEHQEALPHLEFSEELGTSERLLKDNLSHWATWASSPQQDLVPGEPPVSLQTITFCWHSSSEEQEEEEEEEEAAEDEVGQWRAHPKDSSTGCWEASSLQRTEVRGGVRGHYMARRAGP